MIVVIPSSRSVDLNYLEPLLGAGHRFIVVDDTEGAVKIDHPDFEVYHWGDRRRMLGAWDEWFPRCNGACRDFGFYLAWRDADDDDIVVALDDDCEVFSPGFAGEVERALGAAERPVANSGGRHANILECYCDLPPGLFPRGFPYEERIGHREWQLGAPVHVEPAFNLGLWRGVFDVNGIDKLEGPEWNQPEARLRHDQVVVPRGVLISVCSMNMQFRRRLVPAAYQWPMHVPVLPGWVVDRYGDIWGGFALKLLMDINDDCMTMGGPMIFHHKAGDVSRNIWQEHMAHLVNREMVEMLSSAAAEVRKGSYLEGMRDLIEGLARRRGGASPILSAYIDHLLPAANAWGSALASARSR